MALNKIVDAVMKHNKEELNEKHQFIKLTNIKGETVVRLKRFDTNTWILNPGSKNEEIVKIEFEESEVNE